MTTVSFIIPVYNQENYISDFLNKLCGLHIENYEIICINDGSVDNTAEILDDFSDRYSYIHVYHIENHGPGYARNLGIENAKGKYITFCDSDDDINPDIYEKMYALATEKQPDLIVSNYQEIFDSGKILEKIYQFKDKEDYWELVRQIAVYSKFYSRDFLNKNNIRFPECYQGEDRVFLAKVIVAKPVLEWIDDISYLYLRHENEQNATLTHSYSYDYFEQRINCWKDFYSICKKEYAQETETNILKGTDFLYILWAKLQFDEKEKGLSLVQELLEPFEDKEPDRKVFGLELKDFLEIKSYQNYAEIVIEERTGKKCTEYAPIENPEISIIIPMYNVGKYIEQCLQSIITQTFTNFEVICIDDGSSDNTVEIVYEYMFFDKRISLLEQCHGRAGVARNLGMTKAKGQFYLFLDGDDFFEPFMLEKSYQKITEDNADICLYGARMFYEYSKKYQKSNVFLKPEYIPEDIPFEGKTFPYIFNVSTASPWNKLIRKSLIDKYNIQFMPLQRCNDVYFIFLSLAVAEKITILNEVFVNYRQSPVSLQATNDKSPWDWYTAIKTLKNKLIELGIFPNVEQSFMNYALSLCIYNLFSLKNGAIFTEFYNRVKTEIFEELGLLSYDPENYYSYNTGNYKKFCNILEYDANEYLFYEKMNENKEKKYWMERAKKTEKYASNIKKSITFKVGEFIMFIPHSIKKVLTSNKKYRK